MLANRVRTTRKNLEFFDEDTTLTSHGTLRGVVQTKNCRGRCDRLVRFVRFARFTKRASLGPRLLAFFYSDDRLPQLSRGLQYFFVVTKSPFMLATSSCFCRRWCCDGMCRCVDVRNTLHNGAPLPVLRRHSESSFTPPTAPCGTTVIMC